MVAPQHYRLAPNLEKNNGYITSQIQLHFLGSRKGSKILQYVPVPLIPKEKCVDPHTFYYPKEIDESMVCAGYLEGKKDACAGKNL